MSYYYLPNMKVSANYDLGPLAILTGLLLLLGQVLGMSANQTTDVANSVEPRLISNCQQGNCPDFAAPFDGIYRPTGEGSGEYGVRVRFAERCYEFETSRDMCVRFKRLDSHKICIDQDNKSAQWIRLSDGATKCYIIRDKKYICSMIGPQLVYTPTQVACDW
jgi:hypothetical protein